jgi:seryl-tRNA synthetase
MWVVTVSKSVVLLTITKDSVDFFRVENKRMKTTFAEDLIEGGFLIPSGVKGVYGFSGDFERIVDGINHLVGSLGEAHNSEVMRFPPVMASTAFQTTGYFRNFPKLTGNIHCFCGTEADHRAMLTRDGLRKDWTHLHKTNGLTMLPAACYPVYPVIAGRGPVGASGFFVDVMGQCFRHEPSDDPTRMQLFRMREFIRIGTADQCVVFREGWMRSARLICKVLELPGRIAVANDPFFGRIGKLMADGQRRHKLKFEMRIRVNEAGNKTACMSFNYHLDKFGRSWGINLADGETAHTACIGFGLERLALAVLRHHGMNPEKFPASVSKVLFSS